MANTRPSTGSLPPTLPSAAPAPGLAPGLAPGTAVGRYVIIAPLGQGGMGVVYLAHDPELGRQVALKVLRPDAGGGEGDSDARHRLVREAHAMARLNHPNVVAIYDAGIYGEQVFLAVERVEGTDLRTWLGKPRSWLEILDVFQKAGRGLAAAHQAGLVHRDFKLGNVLIGPGGVVKVADFGIARFADRAPGASVGKTGPGDPADETFSTPITHPDIVSGTPAYMAPEQLQHGRSDARSDEFSFCVALYEALYGRRPFAVPGGGESGTVADPPKGTQVPGWVRKVLLRGLSIRPEDRYPTIEELLRALDDNPAMRHGSSLTLVGFAALLIAAVGGSVLIVLRQRAAADPCHAPAGRLAGVWDDSVPQRLRAAFAATGVPDSSSVGAYAEKAMERAGGAWVAAYEDACEATRVRRSQPEAALNLRLDCLADQRLDLQAAAEIMLHPDPKDLSAAIGAAVTLPLPSECADARALSVIEQPTPEHRPAVEALRLQLARARALDGAGRSSDAIAVLGPLPERAHALGAAALEARALAALARAYQAEGRDDDQKKALELYGRAARAAEAAHLDQLATYTAALEATDEALLGHPAPEVDTSLERARQDLRRAASVGTGEYIVEEAVTVIERLRGRDAEAAVHGRHALQLADALFGEGREEPMDAANNLAAALEALGRYDEMAALFRKAAAGSDFILGPKNPLALVPALNIAEILYDLGRFREAAPALDQLFARTAPEVDRDELATGLAVQAALQAASGQTRESLQSARHASDMAARLHLPASPNWIDLHRYVTEAYLRDGIPALALDEFQKFLAHQDLEALSPQWVCYLRLGGWAYLDSGQPGKALPVLERGLKLSSTHPFYPGWVPRLRYQLARALIAAGGDRMRAESLAQAAHDELQRAAVRPDLLAEVDGWRAKTFQRRAGAR